MLSANFKPKTTAAASRGFLATARLSSCFFLNCFFLSDPLIGLESFLALCLYVMFTLLNKKTFLYLKLHYEVTSGDVTNSERTIELPATEM